MPDQRFKDLEVRWELQKKFLRDPWHIYPIFPRPFGLKILMVTDGGGSFGRADFGLSALLDALATPPGPWVRFQVTKAHRRNDPSADLTSFRFDSHDLAQYDQIWMFAVERSGSAITQNELSAIAQFMDAGGGVFATGDHEDLGVAMCGGIPRVRSMRKWHWPSPGPNGEPVAPNVGGPDRFDTLSAGNDPGVQFDDQSDDVPQVISPTLYSTSPWTHYFYRARPHPVLCGPRGMITRMPDHPHEGECYVPSDLSATLTFAGYTTTEYPSGRAPEVIARSRVPSGRSGADVKGTLHPRTFGSIGAYDGHGVNVGRVVVDSTWHHFFDINLVGELGTLDPVKSVGFDFSSTGHAAYEDIQSYYRNIAVWIASKPAQGQMWWRALWWTRWHHRLVMDLRPPYLTGEVALDLSELVRVGSEARDALGRVASQCTVYRWIIDEILVRRFPKIWDELGPIVDPWQPSPPLPDPAPDRRDALNEPLPNLGYALHAEVLVDAVMGAAVYAVATRFPTADEEALKRAESEDLAEDLTGLVADHVEVALTEFAAHVQREGRRLGALSKSLRHED